MKPSLILHSFLLAAGSSLLAVSSAYAQSGTWNADANGVWSTDTNWLFNTIATGSGNTANFTNDITADRTVSLDGDRTLTNLIFGDSDTVTAGSWILNNNGVSTNNLILAGTTPTITVNALGTDKTATISAIIEGTAGLTKAGTGTLILSGANTYTGTTIVNAGILQWGANNALASGDLTVNSGGTITMGTFTDTVGTITLNRGIINVATGFVSGNSLKTGSGGFITTGGTVNNWPGIGLGGNFAYNTDSGNETTASIAGIDFNGASRTFTIADGVQAIDVDITVSLFSAAAGDRNFIKAGAGTMRISGGNSGNFNLGAGTTSILDGTLLLNKSTNRNAVGGTGLVTVGDGLGSANSAVLRYVGGNDQIGDNAITINSDGLFDIADKTDTVGAVILAGGSIASTTGVLTGTSYDFRSGSVSARLGGAVALTKSTADTVTLSGANTYTGLTTISTGSLAISHNNALGGTGVGGHTTIAAIGNTTAGGVLQLSGSINTPENITITGTTEQNSFAGAIQSTSGDNTLSGNITLAGSDRIRLSTTGTGSLTLSGNITQSTTSHGLTLSANTGTIINVNNAIAINGGILRVFAAGKVVLKGASGSGIGNTIINQGGTIELGINNALNTTGDLEIGQGGTTTNTFDLASYNQTIRGLTSTGSTTRRVINSVSSTNSILTVGNGGGDFDFAGTILNNTGTGGTVELRKTGSGNQTLSGTNTFTGGTRIDEGILTLGHATDTLSNSGAVNVNGGTLALGTNADTVGAVTLTSGNITGSGTASEGVLTGTGSAFDVRSGSVSAKLAGSVGLIKSTAGTVTLSATNTYTGATNIDAGTLQLDGSTAAGSTVNIGTAGTLTGTGTVNGNATLTGSGVINKSSTGTIAGTLAVTGGNWNGAGTVTGAITSHSGTFSIGNGANLTASSGVLLTGGSLVVNGTLTGGLTANSSTTLSGSGTVTGDTTISGTHSPGNSPGIQSFTNLTYESGSNVIWELVANSTTLRGTNFDGINVGGTLNFNGATTLTLSFNFGASAVEWQNTFWDNDYTGTDGWLVYSGATSLVGFENLSLNAPTAWFDESGDLLSAIRPNASFSLFQDGNNIFLNYQAIPEPSTALLGGLGLLALLRRRR